MNLVIRIIFATIWTGVFVLLSLMLLSGCGEVKHSGEATVHHIISVDTAGLTEFFTQLCDANGADDVEVCALREVDEFISFIEGRKAGTL